MEENFLFFLGTVLFLTVQGRKLVPLWGKISSSWEDFHASCVFKIAANQLLLGKRFLLGFGKRDKGLSSHSPEESPGAFFFTGVLASWEAAKPREPECVQASSLQGPSTSFLILLFHTAAVF